MISPLEGPLLEAADRAELAGRLAEAKRALRRALAADPRSPQALLRMASLLCSEGLRGPARRLLSRAEKLNAPKLAPRQWFSGLMKAGLYPQAFRAAESLLDAEPEEAARVFWQPWEGVLEQARRAGDLEVLNRLRSSRSRRAIWATYFHACLSRDGGALLDHERLAGLPPRYAWMSLRAGHTRLHAGDFGEATRLLRRAAALPGMDWKARAYLAEALACSGRRSQARREMRRAQRLAPLFERASASAWLGEMELWSGSYRRALPILDLAARSGAQHAHCWLAAAKLKLGRRAEALEDLERTIRLYPVDQEAHVWRAEALRLSGRPKEALKALRGRPGGVWALINRALAFRAIGQTARMRRQFEALPEAMRAYLGRRVRLKNGSWSDTKRLRALRLALRLAKGYRREDYLQAIWMR